eukprot:Hpha_TRINITY_DN16444_c0_g1::TRINITY_DN16444_c0_g1_i2::g.161823::m.161823/K06225/PTCH1; patched 1
MKKQQKMAMPAVVLAVISAAQSAEVKGARVAQPLQSCNILGAVPLPFCPPAACASATTAAAAIMGGQAIPQADIDAGCAEYDRCIVPFFENAIVKTLAGDTTAESFCATANPKCNIMGIVPVKGCYSDEACTILARVAAAMLGGQVPATQDYQAVCRAPIRESCLSPFFDNSLVQGAAGGISMETFCSAMPPPAPACKILGVVSLSECPNDPCASGSLFATSVLANTAPDPYHVRFFCEARDECAEPFFANAIVQGLVPGVTTVSMCGEPIQRGPVPTMPPSCPVPGSNTGQPSGKCSMTQRVSGLQCCDDALGELPLVNESCNTLADTVSKHCSMNVNERLKEMWRCPVSNESKRTVADLCPLRCKNRRVAGCECPNSYDKGCPDKQCLVADTSLYDWEPECSDCWVNGARLQCKDPLKDVRNTLIIVMITCIGVLTVAVAGYTVTHWATSTNEKKRARRRSSFVTEIAEHMPKGVGKVLRGANDCFERYKQFFDHICYQAGWFLSEHRALFFTALVFTMLIMAVCGLAQAEIEKNPSSEDWTPEGSDLERQVKYFNKWSAPSADFPLIQVMVSSTAGESVMKRKYVRAMHHAMEKLREVSVEVPRSDGNGTIPVSYEDFCLRIPENPAFDAIYPGEKPCVHPGVLDCFFEGAWQIENVSQHKWPDPVSENTLVLEEAVRTLNAIFGGRSAAVDNYQDRDSYMNLTDDEIADILSEWDSKTQKKGHGRCMHWANSYTVYRDDVVGSSETVPPKTCPPSGSFDRAVSAQSLGTIMFLASIDSAQSSRKRLSVVQANDLLEGRRQLKKDISDKLSEMNDDEVAYPGIRTTVVHSDFYEEVVSELQSAQTTSIVVGYLLMILIIALEASIKNPCGVENLFPVALLYYLTVMPLATAAAYGIIALAGIKFNHLMLQVLPYLSIGLGVDDMFLLLHYFRAVDLEGKTSQDAVADLVKGGGRSVALTSLTNLITFFGAASVKIPALRYYLLLGGTIVLLNFVSSVVCLPLLLSWWTDKANRDGMKSPTSVVPDPDAPESAEPQTPVKKMGKMEMVVASHFVPFMQKKPVQVCLTVTWLILFVFFTIALFSFAQVKADFKITDFAPKGTYLEESVSEYQEHFFGQVYRHSWVTEVGDGSGDPVYGQGLNIADPEVQQKYQLAAYRLGQLPTGVSKNATHWLTWLYDYLADSNPAALVRNDSVTGEPAKTKCSFTCLADFNGNESYCRSIGECEVYYAGHPWYANDFYFNLHNWRDPIISGVHQITAYGIGADAFGYRYGPARYNPEPGCQEPGCNNTNTMMLEYSSLTQVSRCLKTPDDWKNHVDEIRALLRDTVGEQAYPKPTDRYFDVELFEETKRFFWTSIPIAIVGIFCAGLVIPVSLRGSLFIAMSGLAATFELTGLLMLMDIAFTTTIAVSIIMAIGLSVDPVVHAVAAYEHSESATRAGRLKHAMEYSTVPIIKSGLSTILSFIMMAFSPFPYVIKYSFLPLLISIIISLLHGVIFIPAVLGLLGSELDVPKETNSVATKGKTVQVAALVVNPLQLDTTTIK